MYKNMAFVYDELMDDIDYEGWFNYIRKFLVNMKKIPNPYWKWLVVPVTYPIIWLEKVMI